MITGRKTTFLHKLMVGKFEVAQGANFGLSLRNLLTNNIYYCFLFFSQMRQNVHEEFELKNWDKMHPCCQLRFVMVGIGLFLYICCHLMV
ncbi:MAG: hypothetical protein CSA33_01750 [Desulfobulbus propionicus]|nr:MAG: hypothetical protein CSA33_01750 [Desulfobulbus propionicus]